MLTVLCVKADLHTTLRLGNVAWPGGEIQNAQVDLTLAANSTSKGTLKLGKVHIGTRHWENVQLQCPKLTLTQAVWHCLGGKLDGLSATATTLDLRYQAQTGQTTLVLQQAQGQLTVTLNPGRAGHASLQHWPLTALPFALPASAPKISNGAVDGTLIWKGPQIEGHLAVRNLAFSDVSGNQAGEKLALRLDFTATQAAAPSAASSWAWDTTVSLSEGELFWAPWYLKAPQGEATLQTKGTLSLGTNLDPNAAPLWSLTTARLHWPGLGLATGSASGRGSTLATATLEAKDLDIRTLYTTFLQPVIADSVLGALDTTGQASVKFSWRDGALQNAALDLNQVTLIDQKGRVALENLSAHWPWQASGQHPLNINWQSGLIWGIPFGKTQITGMSGVNAAGAKTLVLAPVRIPLLSGHIALNDLALTHTEAGWEGALKGELTHLSLPELSQALGWPVIEGELEGSLPRLVLTPAELRVFGPIEINAFDGLSFIRNLRLATPFGATPTLTADVSMQNLDLGRLTRTFSFGNIEGRLDGTIDHLVLVNWKTSQFNALFLSSPGNYTKKISQKAVANISSLGGNSAGAAVQRSLLRFFENFGYTRLGMGCVLRNGICQMRGVSAAPNGYYLVEGGGIPSINVIGYNQTVNWPELIARLRRITSDTSKPIVR